MCNVVSQESNNLDSVEEKNLSTVISSLPNNCVFVFSDAAFDKNTNLSGIGLVMNNTACSFIEYKLKAGIVRDAEEAESLALLDAVTLAKDKSLEKMCFVSNAKSVIDYFNFNSNQLF